MFRTILFFIYCFTYTQLESNIKTNYDQKWSTFSGNKMDIFQILFKNNDSILIGTKNIIYNISLNTFIENRKQRIIWESNTKDQELCMLKGKLNWECKNYIQIFVHLKNDKFLICGTNSFKPLCRHYNLNDFSKPTKEFNGQGICSYNPIQKSVFLFSEEKIYSATNADFSGKDALIFRQPLRTEQFNENFFNQPTFIEILETKEYILFFFREIAVEYCEKKIFSRVARVCKNDRGGSTLFYHERWSSFLKTRLTCSIPGEFPFFFDELQSLFKKEEKIYAIFTTSKNAIFGSALCVFRINDLLNVFEGNFKSQKDPNSKWLTIPNVEVPEPRPGKCVQNSRKLPIRTINFIKNNFYMDSSVDSRLLYFDSKHHFTAIVVDSLHDVFFVGTNIGKILKLIFKEKKLKIINEIQALPVQTSIKQMIIAQNSLIVVSENIIVSIPLVDCSLKKTCFECFNTQECVWSLKKNQCIFNLNNTNVHEKNNCDFSISNHKNQSKLQSFSFTKQDFIFSKQEIFPNHNITEIHNKQDKILPNSYTKNNELQFINLNFLFLILFVILLISSLIFGFFLSKLFKKTLKTNKYNPLNK